MEDLMASIRDRLEAVLAASAARDEQRVFLKLYPEAARAEADAADRRRTAGLTLGPLDGKLVSVKDLFDVAGEATTAGSQALQPPAMRSSSGACGRLALSSSARPTCPSSPLMCLA
jgi:aspartyl-tRNA(Asn)/glutamyl-tRNA(Gln) amidotransferase subunit A